MSEINIDRLPTRRYAHPFDRPVRIDGDEGTRGVDASPDAIGGCYGIGWREVYKDHRTERLYVVHCSDGVNHSKSAHSDKDAAWMEAMRKRIIDRTRHDLGRPIKLSTREWRLMLNYHFLEWLDRHHTKSFTAVGDDNRLLDEGQVGTINGIAVVVDPGYQDDLPEVGDYSESPATELFPPHRSTRSSEPASRFAGIFAAAFQKAGIGT
jgi:hypothetical protein